MADASDPDDDGGFDERPTPPARPDARRPRRIQTSDDRDLAARRSRTNPHGVPAHVPPPAEPPEPEDMDTTSPVDLFAPQRAEQRRRGDSVSQLAAQLRLAQPDPYDLIAALGFELTDAKRQDRSANKELERQLKTFLAQQPGGQRFEELAKSVADLAPLSSAVRWLTRSFVAVAIAIGCWLYARGGKETAIDMRIDQLQKDSERVQSTVEKLQGQLERRERTEPPHP